MNHKSKQKQPIKSNKIRKWFLRHPKLNPFEVFKFGYYKALTAPLRVLPDFIIIGAAKCGTTSLYDYMIQHPDIYSASRKEIHYFDLHRTGWYRSNFPTIFFKKRVKNNNKQFVTGEATPNYLFFPNVPKEVHKMCPNVKLIILLRNPVDRAYSHYHHQIRKKLLPPRENERENLSFDDAVKSEKERLDGEWENIYKDKSYPNEKFRNFSYLSRGNYFEQIERWMEYFPKKQFLIIKTEELNTDTQNILNKVFTFVGVTNFQVKDLKKLNTGKYEEMKKTTKEYLIEYFKPQNQKLSKLLNINFDRDN